MPRSSNTSQKIHISSPVTPCTAPPSPLLASLLYAPCPHHSSFSPHLHLDTHPPPRTTRSPHSRRKHPPLFRIKIRLPFLRGTRSSHRQHSSRHSCGLPQVCHHRINRHHLFITLLSMGTAWTSSQSYPWEQGLYVGGLETVKVNLTLRIYSNQWHVYAGLAILNPSAQIQIKQ